MPIATHGHRNRFRSIDSVAEFCGDEDFRCGNDTDAGYLLGFCWHLGLLAVFVSGCGLFNCRSCYIQALIPLIGLQQLPAISRLFGAAQPRRYHDELFTTFGLIAANPRIARERLEISPPVRIYPFKAHLIVYLIEKADNILIGRVRHGHEDWAGDAP